MGLILGVDFDGTVAKHVYPAIGAEVPYAFEVLEELKDLDARFVLFTMRSDEPPKGRKVLTEAVDWCRQRGLEFWGINVNPDQHEWTASPKAYCHCYMDDNAFGCPLIYPPDERPYVDWLTAKPTLLAMAENYRSRSAAPKWVAARSH